MKKNQNGNKVKNGSSSTTNNANRFIPTSLKFISSCIKTVSSNVRSASASLAGDSDDIDKDQVLWACFDRLELGISYVKRVLLLGYSNGFQVLDVEDASNISELVSRRDDPVTFLQIQPIPLKSGGVEGYRKSHPLLVAVASDGASDSSPMQNGRDGSVEPHMSSLVHYPTTVRFYSFRSHNYVHVLRFRSAIYMVRCSPRVVAVGLAAQIYCFDAVTLENKFSVFTYPVPQLGSQGSLGINIGYGPMAVGPRWLAYSPRNPLSSNMGRLSPQSRSPSPGVSPSTSPGSGSLVARYAMESSKQLAAGLINLGDRGFKTLSKYCHELLPDGSSSPVSSSSNWKVSRFVTHSAEMDTAGMVVIKDFMSSCVISQFRAHTSPISVLCFDPSGTLLVTASIHGNNINIFRIMPTCSQNGSSNYSFDWTSSYVHLFKLHRGMTPAVIQDICFSLYSQWIAIVSSRGTFHIFVISPFGGETGLQIQNSHVYGPIHLPLRVGPWWSTSSFISNQSSVCPSPPATVTLSVVSRIRNGNSWWINTVSNAASSAGQATISSGVFAAVFHSSVNQNLQPGSSNINSLEHMLVYTPPGNVIQYELLPSIEGAQGKSSLRIGTSSLVHMQEEDLQVKAEPVRWWDVCRRADWPESEEPVLRFLLDRQEAAKTDTDASGCEQNEIWKKDCSVKSHEQLHYYLSNAEVQVHSGRIPIWQKSKICFYTKIPCKYDEVSLSEDFIGEFEIEKIPVHEVGVRQRELLPVFDCFHHIHPDWSDDSGIERERNSAPSSDFHGGKESFSGDTIASHAQLISPGLADNYLDIGSRRTSEVNDLEEMGTLKSYPSTGLMPNENCRVQTSSTILESYPVAHRSFSRVDTPVSPQLSANIMSSFEERCIKNDNSSIPKIPLLSNARTAAIEAKSSNSILTSDSSNKSSHLSDISMNIIDEGTVHEDIQDALDFEPYFQEEYCKAPASNGSGELTEIVPDVNSNSSPHEKDKLEDGEANDLLGGVFAFSEEG